MNRATDLAGRWVRRVDPALHDAVSVPGWLFAFACGAVLWAVILKALGVL